MEPKEQLSILNKEVVDHPGESRSFRDHLSDYLLFPLKPRRTEILQLNLGYMCNQSCRHCHVDAGPHRKEMMERRNLEIILEIIQSHDFKTIDLTGGAPEMHPDFRWFVTEIARSGVPDLIIRSNLTIINANKKYHYLPSFFRENGVHVVSSLPFYKRLRTDKQRGRGVFDRSIDALKKLNDEGYGIEGSGLLLDLVYNPAGAFLPGDQKSLEIEFKEALSKDHGIEFNQLLSITNLPISRYLEFLLASGNLSDYMDKLIEGFNPVAAEDVMCRNTISVDWRGYLYDCDFNQMLQMPIDEKFGHHISNFDPSLLESREIKLDAHCFGCTAGAGSSCGGALT
jgi:radical SAM/Cys-rich protein